MKNSFFCEACGASVKSDATSCPKCGRSFLGVRCPRCDKEGSAEDFLRGCPDCGFMTPVPSGIVEGDLKAPVKSRKPLWPASRYWILSLLIIVFAGGLFVLWLSR